VKRPVPTCEQSVERATVVEADWPPGYPSPQLLTATAETVADVPVGASTEPENEFVGSTNAPVATTTPLTRISIREFWAKTLVVSHAVAV